MWLIKVNPNGSVEYFKGMDQVFIPERLEEKARRLFAERYELKMEGDIWAEGYVFQDVRSLMPGLVSELKMKRSLIWEYRRKGGLWWEHRWVVGVEVREVEKFFGNDPRFWHKWRRIQGYEE